MVRTIEHGDADIHHRIAGYNTVVHSFLNTGFHRSDVFFRNSAADNLVFELEAFAGLQRSQFQPAVTILAFTTGLTNEFAFALYALADGFSVGYLRVTHSAVYVEFSLQTVNNDIQVKFAHTGNNGLGRFSVSADTERRIFFSQFSQGDAHLFLVSFRLRFDGYGNNRFREDHGFQDNRSFFIAQGVTGAGVFQANSSSDIAGIYIIDFRSVVGVHTQDTANTFSLVFVGVVYIGASAQSAGVNAEESQTTNIGVGSDFEGQSCERLVIIGRPFFFFAGFRVRTFDRRYIQRRRHVVDDGIQQRLYAFILVGRTAGYREQLALASHFPDSPFDFFFRQVFAFQVFHHQVIVAFSNSFQQDGTILLCFFYILFRDGFEFFILAQLIPIYNSLHLNQVDNPFEAVFSTDGQLNGYCVGTQAILHHLDYVEEVCAGSVHFVYICNTGNVIFFRLTPYGFRLRFNTAFSTEHSHGAVQYTQGPFYFYSEVHVARGVDDVDGMSFPMAGRSSGSNRNTTFLFLYHPVHGGSAIVNFTDLVNLAGVEQDTFSGSSFTGIDVSHDADVSDFL